PLGTPMATYPFGAFKPIVGKYYFWSVHTFLLDGKPQGYIANSAFTFGQLVFKQSEWACSYGIKRATATAADPVVLSLANHPSASTSANLRLADLQIIEFDQFSDALSYANSRVFAYIPFDGPFVPMNEIPTQAYFRWNEAEEQFDFGNGYNIRTIDRISAGLYRIEFVLSFDQLPVVNITPSVSMVGEPAAIVASFDDLTTTGMVVSLVKSSDNMPTDVSFGLMAR
ncbi:MAG: hypothetical protein JSS64_15485, partial [Bacteroidetes bacterium]|nr:hypothetical protein [Bacteroidota bacterium]